LDGPLEDLGYFLGGALDVFGGHPEVIDEALLLGVTTHESLVVLLLSCLAEVIKFAVFFHGLGVEFMQQLELRQLVSVVLVACLSVGRHEVT